MAMQLEDYFTFEKLDTKHGVAERIRIKGHRISIENVLEYYHEGYSPEQIAEEVYPGLSLEKVNAAITYYLQNKAEVEAYIARGDKIGDAFYQEFVEKGPFFLRDEGLARRKTREAGNGTACE